MDRHKNQPPTLEEQMQDVRGRIIRTMNKLENARTYTGSILDGEVNYENLYRSLLWSVKGSLKILNGEA